MVQDINVQMSTFEVLLDEEVGSFKGANILRLISSSSMISMLPHALSLSSDFHEVL